MRKMNKKGFTIVELVIVIAVIAILAAVLIPTYSSLVKKANQSADIQAVRQMNTILATYTDGSVSNVKEAIEALDKENIDLENYKPMQKDHYFYFYMDGNTPKIVYMDKDNKPVFPTDAKITNVQLMSLSGDVPVDKTWEDNTSTDNGVVSVEIANGGQFADFMNNIDSYMVNDTISEIKITLSNDVNLLGSTASFGEVKKPITLDANGKTISGIRADSNSVSGSWDNEPKTYGYALFNMVGANVTVTVKNVKFADIVVGNSESSGKAYGHSAILFGKVEGTIKMENVILDNCKVYGADKVGSLIGYLSGTADLKNVTVTNTAVYGLGFVARAIGVVSTAAKVQIDNVNCDGVTTAINEARWSDLWYASDENWLTDKAVQIEDVSKYVPNSENTYLPWINDDKNQFQGMTTNDLYWVDNITHDDTGVLSDYKVEIDGKAGGYKISSSQSQN